MHDLNLAWYLLCTNRYQLKLEQKRRVNSNGIFIYSAIILFFSIFLISTSNPFLKVPFPCLNSLAELNPVLQDPVLAIHPPCIYAGYVASAICFSLSLSLINYDIKSLTNQGAKRRILRLTTKDSDSSYYVREESLEGRKLKEKQALNKLGVSETRQLQFWILACWSFLTVGILLGSWWAYHELGWGGWWFWDPVENASLMPWLLATACIHMKKVRSKNLFFVLLLSTFILSILGTFFVRSGLLASVHSFATDSTRAIYLLFFLLSIILISLIKFYQFQKNQKQVILKSQLEQILYLQNLFFSSFCIVVLCGTSAPLLFQWFWGQDLSTGAPFYNGTLIPLFTSVFLLLVITHYTQLRFTSKIQFLQKDNQNFWRTLDNTTKTILFFFRRKRINKEMKEQRCFGHKNGLQSKLLSARSVSLSPVPYAPPKGFFFFSICLSSILHIICLNFLDFSFLESLYGTICILLISNFILSKKNRFLRCANKFLKFQPSRVLTDLTFARKKSLSMRIGHTGIVFFIAGILLSNALKIQITQRLHCGSRIRLGPQISCLRSIDHAYAPTYHSICGNLVVYQQGKYGLPNTDNKVNQTNLCMFPEKRFFFSNQELTTTKVAIHTNMLTDYYGLIGTGSLETGWYTTIMKLPFIFCIWLGFSLATIGGVLGLKRQLERSKLKWT